MLKIFNRYGLLTLGWNIPRYIFYGGWCRLWVLMTTSSSSRVGEEHHRQRSMAAWGELACVWSVSPRSIVTSPETPLSTSPETAHFVFSRLFTQYEAVLRLKGARLEDYARDVGADGWDDAAGAG